MNTIDIALNSIAADRIMLPSAFRRDSVNKLANIIVDHILQVWRTNQVDVVRGFALWKLQYMDLVCFNESQGIEIEYARKMDANFGVLMHSYLFPPYTGFIAEMRYISQEIEVLKGKYLKNNEKQAKAYDQIIETGRQFQEISVNQGKLFKYFFCILFPAYIRLKSMRGPPEVKESAPAPPPQPSKTSMPVPTKNAREQVAKLFSSVRSDCVVFFSSPKQVY